MRNRICWALLACALVLNAGHAPLHAAEALDSVALLHRELPEKEAAIWYLGQDSFAVKTRNHLLIFDPFNPGMENSYVLPKSANSMSEEGVVNPETIKDLKVVVFVSNMGDTHHGTGIWPWRRYIRNIDYVFGWNPIINQDNHEYYYLKPREQRTIEGVEVSTIQSVQYGVGFLVKVDGLVLFHGGNHLLLDAAQRPRFTREIDFLASQSPQIDIAFLEFQIGAGQRPPSIASGIWYADQKLSPRVIFPMGAVNAEIPWRERRTPAGLQATATTHESLIKDLIREAPSDAVRAKIVETGKRGNVFMYREGGIARP